ncbi:MAG: hypothetical protein AAGA37_10815 [Actinomycetota bacterium]
MRRILIGILGVVLLATSCEIETVDSSPEMLIPVPADQSAERRSVGEAVVSGDVTGDLSAQASVGVQVELSAPLTRQAPTASVQLVWALDRDASPAGSLHGAVVGDPFEVRLELENTFAGVERVEWYLDSVLFRNDDVQPPYNMRYNGLLPIEETFVSDQGLDASWVFQPGTSHEIAAKVLHADGWTAFEAEFTIAGDPAAPTTTAPTTTTPVPTNDNRPVVVADASTVLDQPNTIYDFQFTSPGDVDILASNVEARNIRGPGTRRIGDRSGQSIADSGFRNFEFTFAHVRMDDGATITRPYFIDGVDVNPQPHVADGDIIQFFAYNGDIIDPLVDNVTVYGKQRPAGSVAHNDGIQFTGIGGGEVWNPTIRNSRIEGASSAAIQAKHVHGVFTIEGNVLSERFGSFHAVIAKPGDGSSSVLWRDNTMVEGSSAAMTGGWGVAPGSVLVDGVTIQ